MKTLLLASLALGLTAAGAGGWAAWNSTALAHRDADAGTMTVAVVAPQEPEPRPGGIMTVGELRNGYVHDPGRLDPPAVLDADDVYLDDAWLQPEAPLGPPPDDAFAPAWTPPVATPVRLEPHDYSFGFDAPRAVAGSQDEGARD